jgi:hypothetical protein
MLWRLTTISMQGEGELWGWGASIYDQLGFGDCLHVLAPKQIALPSRGEYAADLPFRVVTRANPLISLGGHGCEG